MNPIENLEKYPGGDLVMQGLADLNSRRLSKEALLVLVASPRLMGLGIEISELFESDEPYEHQLFSIIEAEDPKGAHAAYNAFIQRIVSFANAYEAAA